MSDSPDAPSIASFHSVPAVARAARALVDAVREAGRTRSLSPTEQSERLGALATLRGQPPALPLLAGGTGRGARVRLADGREILDMVSGIGPYAFGHDDQELLETAAVAAAGDVAFQGHVLPGQEYLRLSETLARLAGPRLAHVFLALSGSMANENAWKMILQRQAPADRALAFEGAFHGRTVAMAWLTDRPAYREGLPPMDFVDRVPFFDPMDPDSTQKSVDALEAALARHPNRHAAMCFELVQGEGGFNDAPASFFRALMSVCRRNDVAVWLDEIQTFARTSELFAFRTLGLEEYVDVVTVGKILHGSATLFTKEFAPREKLVAGTWAGASVGMAIGARILERLEQDGYLGRDGRIADLDRRLDRAFAALDRALPGVVTARSGRGAMQAFVAWDGEAEVAREIIETSLNEGALFQTAGGDPTKIRLLPPLNLSAEELDAGFASLERALLRVAARRQLPIG